MATKTNELPLAQSVSLTDNLLVDTPAGTKILPVGSLPQALTADKLLMPDRKKSIAEYYRQFSNRNLLHNWYFPAAINQRGKTAYNTINNYTIDRWFLGSNGTITLTDNGLIVSSNAAFLQILEKELSDYLNGKTVTISLLTNFGIHVYTNTFPSEGLAGGSRNGVNIYIQHNSSGVAYISFHSDQDTTFIAAKLELGDHQTLAHKEGDTWVLNDPLPDPALELAKCQRYFERVYLNTGSAFACTASNRLKANAFYKVRKRATPSIKYYPMYLVRHGDNTGVFGSLVSKTPVDGGKSVDSCTMAFTEEQVNPISVGQFAYLGAGSADGLTYFDVSSDL